MLLNILKFLNENSGAVNVIFSGLVTVATLVYAVLTWKLVTETRRMRKAQTDAKVTVRVEPREETLHLLKFIIANEGIGPAYDIKFEIVPIYLKKIDASIREKIQSFGFFNSGIEYLSPSQRIETFLTSVLEDFDSKIDTSFNIKISYKNSSKEYTEDLYLIDFSIFKGLTQVGKSNLYTIAQEIEKIQKDFHNIATGFKELKVITQSKADHRQEEKEMFEEFKKNQSKKDQKRL
ncbi:MAG: hypothetical protein KKE44_04565 [Proteobacteria bacterium]|nr:hypothetical protein [Pseudomonadota bacterium]MBU1582004.1 hypothetical protein [Pseudomonadota bacterium]MBU2455319.1 hypothetical protein [Pseudomonadota bacterium]MBU2628382.1 hypothetical protein [Pseudomonadota bacterium]